MSQVPIKLSELERIVEVVARELLEQWAIDDRFTEDQLEQAQQNAVNDTVLVVNNFMNYFNEVMLTAKPEDNKSLII